MNAYIKKNSKYRINCLTNSKIGIKVVLVKKFHIWNESINKNSIFRKEVEKINDEDNTAEYEQYKNNLNTPQLYTNGKYYKPTWAEIYSGKVKEIFPMVSLYEKVGGETSVILDLKITIYDATGKVANAEMMSVKEIIELWLFLLKKQEEFFNIYKASLNR